jgi:RNA polymerase sigma-70 factor (ECF subfamily)
LWTCRRITYQNQVVPFGRPLPTMLECVPDLMPAGSTSSFRTTSWTVVFAASVDSSAEPDGALSRLCQIYWHPVYAFIRRRGYDRDQAEDLTQGFFTQLLAKNYLLDADRERGRFRSFLLTAVKRFLANEWDRSHAVKRGGGHAAVSIDLVEAERWYAPATVEAATPERLFERRWALSLLEHVMDKLRAEFDDTGRGGQFETLVVFLNREPHVGLPIASEVPRAAQGRDHRHCRRARPDRRRDTVPSGDVERLTRPLGPAREVTNRTSSLKYRIA